MMKARPTVTFTVAVLIAAFALLAMILPALANSGDYGVNTGSGNTVTCPPGQTPVDGTTGTVCISPTTVPTATPIPPTNTPAPPTQDPNCKSGQTLRQQPNGDWICEPI